MHGSTRVAFIFSWIVPGSALAEARAAGDVPGGLWLALGALLALAVAALAYALVLRRHLRRSVDRQQWTHHAWAHAMDFLPDPMYVVDLDDNLVLANAAFYRQANKSAEQCLGQDIKSLIHLKPEDKPCPGCLARKERRDAFFTKEKHDHSNPTGKPIEVTIRVVRNDRQEAIGILSGIRDLSHLRATEEALFEQKERAQVTLNSIGDAVITTDVGGSVDYMNPSAEKLSGLSLATVRGRHCRDVFNLQDERSEQPVKDIVLRCLNTKSDHLFLDSNVLIRADGARMAVNITAAAMHDRAGRTTGVVIVLHDVTEMRSMTRKLNYQATHDSLTGLINRREFEVRLSQAIDGVVVDRGMHALIYLDLDQFKIVNDTCGHAAGDLLIRQVAELFQGRVRVADTLARIGGDEFAVLLLNCPLDRAVLIAEQILDDVRQLRFVWNDRSFGVGVSMGIVAIDQETAVDRDVLGKADAACYVAKGQGRNRLQVYCDGDDMLSRHRGNMRWVNEINAAFEEHRFLLYCQEIVSLRNDGEAKHLEFLLRMRGPDGDIITPGQFLPAAERFGMIRAIDKWVVRAALAEIGALHRQRRLGETMYSINLSGETLSDPVALQEICAQVAASGVPGRAICFEVTETAAISNLRQARKFIGELHGLGVRFALDDFGTGLSSFAYLKELSVDFLKIDGAFIRDITTDPVGYELVRTINQIGQLLQMQTIAEFVESAASLQALRDIGVDYAQGYYLSEPKLFSVDSQAADHSLAG